LQHLEREEAIRTLVFTFYGRVREDPVLSPIFEEHIGDRWDTHLEKMCDFWSTVLYATGRYRGNPLVVHARIPGIGTPHFDRWLELFEEVAFETLSPDMAQDVVARSIRIRAVLEPKAGTTAAHLT